MGTVCLQEVTASRSPRVAKYSVLSRQNFNQSLVTCHVNLHIIIRRRVLGVVKKHNCTCQNVIHFTQTVLAFAHIFRINVYFNLSIQKLPTRIILQYIKYYFLYIIVAWYISLPEYKYYNSLFRIQWNKMIKGTWNEQYLRGPLLKCHLRQV